MKPIGVMKHWFSHSPFACKRYAHLASKRRDQQLTFVEKLSFLFHNFICGTCRRFNLRIDLIDSAMHTTSDATTESPEDRGGLSKDAKEKILKTIEDR